MSIHELRENIASISKHYSLKKIMKRYIPTNKAHQIIGSLLVDFVIVLVDDEKTVFHNGKYYIISDLYNTEMDFLDETINQLAARLQSAALHIYCDNIIIQNKTYNRELKKIQSKLFF